jgi:hypothetical protein
VFRFFTLRHSRNDAYLIGLSIVHALVLVTVPSVPLIAAGMWWNSNSVSHHFLHLPFFTSRMTNRIYSLYLTVLLGIPQSVWRNRHLAHHRGSIAGVSCTPAIIGEVAVVLLLWLVLARTTPEFFWTIYIPGYVLGLGLCYLHGYFEHDGGTISTYGTLYNFAFFNDGYHVEHHEHPSEHWTRMPQLVAANAKTSGWPAAFRWLDCINLELLERVALRSRIIQSILLKTHRRALRGLLPHAGDVRTAAIVGGGMYPRTALLLRELLPDATIRIVDRNQAHLEIASRFLDSTIEFEHSWYNPRQGDLVDLLVIPLSFQGRRESIYRNPPSRAVLVHDWIWAKHGRSTIVSWFLLKRLNLVLR